MLISSNNQRKRKANRLWTFICYAFISAAIVPTGYTTWNLILNYSQIKFTSDWSFLNISIMIATPVVILSVFNMYINEDALAKAPREIAIWRSL